jgi:hypothetical protein
MVTYVVVKDFICKHAFERDFQRTKTKITII